MQVTATMAAPGDQPIHAACRAGDATAVQRLLEEAAAAGGPAEVASAATAAAIGHGMLPLHIAAMKGHTAVVQLLLAVVDRLLACHAIP